MVRLESMKPVEKQKDNRVSGYGELTWFGKVNGILGYTEGVA